MKKDTDSAPQAVGEDSTAATPQIRDKHGGRRARAGAKPHEFDLVLLRNLCRIQCTDAEIASILRVSERTIKRHKKRREFREAMDAGKAEGRVSVRRMLFKLAEQGNVAATIFLSKNLLGYRNSLEVKNSDSSHDDVQKAMEELEGRPNRLHRP